MKCFPASKSLIVSDFIKSICYTNGYGWHHLQRLMDADEIVIEEVERRGALDAGAAFGYRNQSD